MAVKRKAREVTSLDIVVAAQNERLNAHDKAFEELKTDIKEILKATVETNLKLAVLPTWENVNSRCQVHNSEMHACAARVAALEESASESKGSWKVIAVVAGFIGTGLAALGNWLLSKL